MRGTRRSPQGECGLKYRRHHHRHPVPGRSPQGECGLKLRGELVGFGRGGSLPARGVWIEICQPLTTPFSRAGRSPQGECGLKCLQPVGTNHHIRSLPARGVWIEIATVASNALRRSGRSPQGECGLKSLHDALADDVLRRSPQGECGLKFRKAPPRHRQCGSLPARGVWIEIPVPATPACPASSRSPQGECGLKFGTVSETKTAGRASLPARGVWIEITNH